MQKKPSTVHHNKGIIQIDGTDETWCSRASTAPELISPLDLAKRSAVPDECPDKLLLEAPPKPGDALLFLPPASESDILRHPVCPLINNTDKIKVEQNLETLRSPLISPQLNDAPIQQTRLLTPSPSPLGMEDSLEIKKECRESLSRPILNVQDETPIGTSLEQAPPISLAIHNTNYIEQGQDEMFSMLHPISANSVNGPHHHPCKGEDGVLPILLAATDLEVSPLGLGSESESLQHITVEGTEGTSKKEEDLESSNALSGSEPTISPPHTIVGPALAEETSQPISEDSLINIQENGAMTLSVSEDESNIRDVDGVNVVPAVTAEAPTEDLIEEFAPQAVVMNEFQIKEPPLMGSTSEPSPSEIPLTETHAVNDTEMLSSTELPSSIPASLEPGLPDHVTTPNTVRLDKPHQPKAKEVNTQTPEQMTEKTTTECGIPLEICEAYNNLFLIIHNMVPNIDSLSIANAVSQTELILETAETYWCIPIVRVYLSNHLLSFDRDLYQAIVQDPPRWLYLSIMLECPLIFKEAMVHIVGQHPKWLWQTTQSSSFDRDIQELIETKITELETLKAKANHDLFQSTIKMDGQNLTLFNIDDSTYTSWFVVQTWR